MDSDTYHELYYPSGHCRECGTMVGLGGYTSGDDTHGAANTYGHATIHTAWHAKNERTTP